MASKDIPKSPTRKKKDPNAEERHAEKKAKRKEQKHNLKKVHRRPHTTTSSSK